MSEWADLGQFGTTCLWRVYASDVVSHEWLESYLVVYAVHLESSDATLTFLNQH